MKRRYGYVEEDAKSSYCSSSRNGIDDRNDGIIQLFQGEAFLTSAFLSSKWIRENNHSFYERNYIDIDIVREDKIMMLVLAIILVTIDVLMELETIEMNRGLTV